MRTCGELVWSVDFKGVRVPFWRGDLPGVVAPCHPSLWELAPNGRVETNYGLSVDLGLLDYSSYLYKIEQIHFQCLPDEFRL